METKKFSGELYCYVKGHRQDLSPVTVEADSDIMARRKIIETYITGKTCDHPNCNSPIVIRGELASTQSR